LNRKGEFNTPFGNSGRPICRREIVMDCAHILKNAEVCVDDFADRMSKAGTGDVVYCDPPYSFAGSNGFIRYNPKLFSDNDHRRLAASALACASRGARVVVSGLLERDLLELYSGWWCIILARKSRVSRIASGRRLVKEVLLLSWQPEVIPGKLEILHSNEVLSNWPEIAQEVDCTGSVRIADSIDAGAANDSGAVKSSKVLSSKRDS
jgi:site-specific DNA-adenine methylase